MLASERLNFTVITYEQGFERPGGADTTPNFIVGGGWGVIFSFEFNYNAEIKKQSGGESGS